MIIATLRSILTYWSNKHSILALTATSFLETVSLRLEMLMVVMVVRPLGLAPPREVDRGMAGAVN